MLHAANKVQSASAQTGRASEKRVIVGVTRSAGEKGIFRARSRCSPPGSAFYKLTQSSVRQPGARWGKEESPLKRAEARFERLFQFFDRFREAGNAFGELVVGHAIRVVHAAVDALVHLDLVD